jgi:arylsulfatase A
VDLEFYLDFIKTAVGKKQPFLAYYSTCLPHFPWEPTPDSADSTIVIFLADNGTDRDLVNPWGDGKRVRGGRGTLTDRGTHVPLMVRWPGRIKAGSICEDLTDFSDLLPTLCGLTGTPLPEAAIHGRSFAPQPLGKPGQPREWIHIQHESARQVRNGHYMLDNKNQLRRVVELWEDPAKPNGNLNPAPEAAACQSRQAVLDALGQ